jgi:hypothetical protein
MKGAYKRFQQRQALRSYHQSMSIYEQTLKALVDATGDGRSYRQGNEKLIFRLNPNQVYSVRCPDRSEYYRSVMIKSNPLSGGFQTLISNPVYGFTPPGIQEVSQIQLFKQIRDMNSTFTISDFKAFPYTGASYEDL